MKKILAFALCAASVAIMSAQNPDAKASYEKAKGFDDEFNKCKIKLNVNPDDQSVDKIKMSDNLMQAYTNFVATLPLDSMPNEKGKVKPKYSKKIYEAIESHVKSGDFINAGIYYFNANKRYPEAYNAFMLGSDLASTPTLQFPDTIIGSWYANAGTCAYGNSYEQAAAAFEKSIKFNNAAPEIYKYLIASYENWAMEDSTLQSQLTERVNAVATDAYNKYGTKDIYVFGKYINRFFNETDADKGISILNQEIEKASNNDELWNMRGMFYQYKGDLDNAYINFTKAAEISSNFIILRDAAKKLYLFGQSKLNEITGDSADAKAKREQIKTNYFVKALDIAQKAQTMPAADGSIDQIIETINYGLETFF